ncbi:unnamed protein product [Gadus morhua 'NCC']
MTKPKAMGDCPICLKALQFVAKHLREIHSLHNNRERGILNFLATGRTLIPARPCSLPGCSPHLLCVEKHLRTHNELRKGNVNREIKALKRATAIKQLAALRATDPHPPIVSTLDQTEDQQSDPEAGVSMCKKRTCVNARLRVREQERELADLRTRLVQLQAKRRPRRASTFLIMCCIFTDTYLEEYAKYLFCPEGTKKMKEQRVEGQPSKGVPQILDARLAFDQILDMAISL